MVAIPAALLAGIGITEVFGPLLADVGRTYLRKPERVAIVSAVALLLSIYTLFHPVRIIRSLLASYDRTSLSDAVAAMEWARENTPAGSMFIVLHRLTEWSPHVIRRTVLNVIEGAEWEPEELANIGRLRELLEECPDIDCIQASVAEMMGYDEFYLMVDRGRLSELTSASLGVGEDVVSFDLMWEGSGIAMGRLSPPEGR